MKPILFRRVLLKRSTILVLASLVGALLSQQNSAFCATEGSRIEVNAADTTGTVSPYFFGQFIEHEHNTIQGGLWAELLTDRKFEQGDADKDGVSNGWVPAERIHDTYWQLKNGRGPGLRYFVDQHEVYGGSSSQGIELSAGGAHQASAHQASVFQISLKLAKNRRYAFYVYVKGSGHGEAFMEVSSPHKTAYIHQSLGPVSGEWRRTTAEFVSPEDTNDARLEIGFQGEGTFWMDSASLMPADNLRGMRRDVVEALRPMRIPLMRYPGGCFADYFHWEDSVGDRDKRPEVFGIAWQEWDPNDFGIDEYMDLAHELGFSPHLTANYTTGTPEEAARWVEYMNGSADTPMGGLRARNGHPDPYHAMLWAVGNEAPALCSEKYTGNTELGTYVKRYAEYKSAMQRVDPKIRLMASSVGDLTWIHNLLSAMPIDLIAISIYTGQYRAHADDNRIYDYTDFYRKTVAEPLEVDKKISENINSIGSAFPQHTRFFAISEINSWWLSEQVDPDYRMANALYFSSVFNGLLRRADQIFTTEASTTLNVQGLIGINPITVKLTPPYWAYVLYANHIGERVVSTVTQSPAVAFNPDLPALDSAATISKDGKTLYLAVVNRAEEGAEQTTIQLKGWKVASGAVHVFELTGKTRDAANAFGNSDEVNIRERSFTPAGEGLAYNFPAHSATILELRAADALAK